MHCGYHGLAHRPERQMRRLSPGRDTLIHIGPILPDREPDKLLWIWLGDPALAGKRRVKAKLREDRCAASRVNDVYAMDFVHGQLATGRKHTCPDRGRHVSRFSPVVGSTLQLARGEDVVQTLEVTCAVVGYPKTIRVDQGSEFISRDLDLLA